MDETHSIFQVIGVLSAIVFIIGDIPYIRDSLKSTTKPHRVTWGIVFLLNSIGFANQYASGADNSLWLFGAAVLVTGAIFLVSLKNGVGGHTKMDIFAIVASLGGLALWYIFDSPLLSILASVFVAWVSVIPTFAKAKRDPESETRITFLLGSISAGMAAISVGKLDYELLILPLSGTIIQAYLVYLLYLRPKKRAQNLKIMV